jgi:hypothetical protein
MRVEMEEKEEQRVKKAKKAMEGMEKERKKWAVRYRHSCTFVQQIHSAAHHVADGRNACPT